MCVFSTAPCTSPRAGAERAGPDRAAPIVTRSRPALCARAVSAPPHGEGVALAAAPCAGPRADRPSEHVLAETELDCIHRVRSCADGNASREIEDLAATSAVADPLMSLSKDCGTTTLKGGWRPGATPVQDQQCVASLVMLT